MTSTRTRNGFSIPAVRWRRIKLADLALAHILLFLTVTLVGFRVRVRVQVKGRGGQLGSTLTSKEINRLWASCAPRAKPGSNLEVRETEAHASDVQSTGIDKPFCPQSL